MTDSGEISDLHMPDISFGNEKKKLNLRNS